MRKIIVVAAGLTLAGCSSFSLPGMDSFKSAPPSVPVSFESLPIGAEAKTSAGQTCKTPCTMSVPADSFSVTFSMPKFQSETLPVLVTLQPQELNAADEPPKGAPIIVDPNPVYVELKPAGPLPRGAKGAKPKAAPKAAKKPKKPAPAPAADDQSAFPPPPSR